MIKRIRIQNLRSLRDSGWIELKPMTLLIGVNSSGKSTFLRWFPLMSQSVNTNLRVPIKWNDDSMVDFGDFASSINHNEKENGEIIFSYELELGERKSWLVPGNLQLRRRLNSNQNIQLSFHYKEGSKGTFISKISLSTESHSFSVNIENNVTTVQLKIDDRDSGFRNIATLPGWRYSLIPTFCYLDKNRDFCFPVQSHIITDIINNTHQFCAKKLKHKEKLIEIINLWDSNPDTFLKNLQKFDSVRTLNKVTSSWTIESRDFLYLYDQIFILNFLSLFDRLNEEIVDMFDGVDYIAPLRAAGKRYYRNVGLQVDKIDPYGNNLGEFIESLTPGQKASYDAYLERVLNIKVKIGKGTGHQSLEIIQGNVSSNLTDVGFGYSQILPIITKLWLATEKGRIRRRGYGKMDYVLTAIEQPELHLHPAMQGKLIDACLRAVLPQQQKELLLDDTSSINNKVKMIIETHSPTIINRIGRRVREKNFPREDVQILVFNKDDDSHDTQIKQVKYDDSGMIEEWPYGFFNPEDDQF